MAGDFDGRRPLLVSAHSSVTRSGVLAHLPHLLEDLFEVVARRQLERRVVDVGHEFLLPQELADGQEVPVIDIRRARRGERTRHRERALLLCPDVILERIAHDVLELSPVVGNGRIKRRDAGGAHHGVVELPVLVAHGRGEAALVVEEGVAIRFFRLSGEVVDLVEPIELGLHDALILARHDLLVQFLPLGAAGDFHERGHPVQRGEHLLEDRARLDDARPADDARSAHAAFPGGQLPGFERGDAAVREGLNLGAVVGGENDDGVVEFAHVFELLEDDADVVVHLLHAGFVGAPVFAALGADHVFILLRQHGGDVHAGRVVPAEERLVGLLGVVAIEPVHDVGGDFLVHRFRALERERTFVLAHLVLGRAVRGLHPQDRPRSRHADAVLGIDLTRGFRNAGNRDHLHRRHDGLLGRAAVDVREADLLHRVEVVEVAPELLEAVRGRQRIRMIAEVVLAELARL